jgi:dTDP-4-dehydrorhamnose 3,5-epimerase
MTDTEIPDVKLLVPKRFADPRGWFCENWNRRTFLALGLDLDFVQDNHSMSAEAGTVRGLHFQIPPAAQAKLVRVVRGSAMDVAVDIRRSSKTFGRHVRRVLSAGNGEQLLIPAGFAHGFVTLEANTEVCYKVTSYYSPQHERGIAWNDPDLKIDWGIAPGQARLSARDERYGRLADAAELFD